MSFEIKGKIISVLDRKDGISKTTGSPWSAQQYVIETEEQYPRKLCFDVFGEDKINQFDIQIDEKLTVFFDIDAKEYQGRWYNSFRAWKVEKTNTQSGVSTQSADRVGNADENREDELDILFGSSNNDKPPF